jgi:hypothetical protein
MSSNPVTVSNWSQPSIDCCVFRFEMPRDIHSERPATYQANVTTSPVEGGQPRRAINELAAVTVDKGAREFILMRDEQNPLQMVAQILKLLYHDLPVQRVKTSESLIDDDCLHGPSVSTGVLPDGERQGDGHAKPLTATQKGHVL